MRSERDSSITERDVILAMRKAIDSIRGELDDLRDALVFEEMVKPGCHSGRRQRETAKRVKDED